MSGTRACLSCVVALVAVLALPAGARAAWVRPVAGRAVAGFAYSRAHPFLRAQRRGVDFAAAPGAVVRAPCPGRVTYAGAVPDAGAGVTLRCGSLVATLLHLGATEVRRGDPVFAGRPLGRAGPAGRVRLGARRAGDRFGYVDPVALLGPARRRVPPPGAPLRPRRADPPPLAPVKRPVMRASRAAPASASAPLAAWIGVALAASGLTAGGARRTRRRRVACATPCPSTSPRRSTT